MEVRCSFRNLGNWAVQVSLLICRLKRNEWKSMLKILFIEDEPTSVETVIEELKQKIEGVKCKVKKFRNAKALLQSFSPDIVVLDIFKGPENDTAGLGVYESI